MIKTLTRIFVIGLAVSMTPAAYSEQDKFCTKKPRDPKWVKKLYSFYSYFVHNFYADDPEAELMAAKKLASENPVYKLNLVAETAKIYSYIQVCKQIKKNVSPSRIMHCEELAAELEGVKYSPNTAPREKMNIIHTHATAAKIKQECAKARNSIVWDIAPDNKAAEEKIVQAVVDYELGWNYYAINASFYDDLIREKKGNMKLCKLIGEKEYKTTPNKTYCQNLGINIQKITEKLDEDTAEHAKKLSTYILRKVGEPG